MSKVIDCSCMDELLIASNENNGYTTITRNIGFYPQGGASPVTPTSPGIFKNDANHPYDVSATFSLTNTQFYQILSYIQKLSNSGAQYNLNSFNCTTFGLSALAQGGISVNSTIGSWPNGQGYDPGDLGQDLKNQQLPGGGSYSTAKLNHANTGNCQ